MIVYLATDPEHKGDRHWRDKLNRSAMTICDEPSGDVVDLALPVTCLTCQTIQGARSRASLESERARILRAAQEAGVTLRKWDVIPENGGFTIDGMDADEWIKAMTQD